MRGLVFCLQIWVQTFSLITQEVIIIETYSLHQFIRVDNLHTIIALIDR